MRVIGIDPGTRHLGWGVLERQGSRIVHVAHGVVDVDTDGSFAARLVEIDDELFLGRTVGEARPVELRGEVDSDFMETVEVEVDSLQLQALEH